jgi:hypothetical protein
LLGITILDGPDLARRLVAWRLDRAQSESSP